jgi:hypothetical protein
MAYCSAAHLGGVLTWGCGRWRLPDPRLTMTDRSAAKSGNCWEATGQDFLYQALLRFIVGLSQSIIVPPWLNSNLQCLCASIRRVFYARV